MYKNGIMKAFTLSYDDGVVQDIRLIELMNKYGIKGTFNLNSGIQTGTSFWTYLKGTARRIDYPVNEIYKGQEVAVHTLTHPDLTKFDYKTVINEIATDKANIEYHNGCKVYGMAYPYGTYSDDVIKAARECGILYSRTIKSTHSFGFSDDMLAYHPTCHHNDDSVFDLAEEFIALKPETPRVFYVWGHSYEFDGDDNWERIEKLFKMISGKDDICYCTNTEAFLGAGVIKL